MYKIMVVDDEVHIRMLYKKEFEREGFEVVVVPGAEGALAAMQAQRPDLVILDIELGGDNGLELLNLMRQNYRDCPIVLNSAYSTYKSDFQSWLADAYIMKSSDLRPLKDKVKSLLSETPSDRTV
jgi:DNA-binding response OmpR family regulator